eukprot:s684_g17.t1
MCDSPFLLGRFLLWCRMEDPGDAEDCLGTLSKSWVDNEHRDLFGRCLDLKHAYKQLARSPQDSWSSVLAVVNPGDSKVYFFEAVALPFGSVSSVLAFNRTARAIRTILSRVFKLVVTNFFDDFCQLELGLLRNSAWRTAETVLELLGWKISLGEDKRHPFMKTFEILGAVISLPQKGSTKVLVSNKESRLVQLSEQVSEIGQCLGQHISRTKIESLKGRPRVVEAWKDQPPILIFTDGAVEDSSAKVTHGALMVDPWKGESFYFGDHVPSAFVNMWQRAGKRQVIAQAEIFPVLIAKETWQSRIDGRSVLWFLDNESARAALVRCFSPILDNFLLLQLNAKLDSDIQARHWYSRVPSRSNPSDDASRLDFAAYTFSERVHPSYEKALKAVDNFWQLMRKIEKGR